MHADNFRRHRWHRAQPQNRLVVSGEAGFTLIELLAVVLIILVLAGLAIGTAGYLDRKAKVSRVKGEIAALELALDAYRADFGYYPIIGDAATYAPKAVIIGSGNSSVQPPTTLIMKNYYLCRALVDQGKTYIAPSSVQLSGGFAQSFGKGVTNIGGVDFTITNIMDPFGSPYNYTCSNPPPAAQVNKMSFDLMSYGPDRLATNQDDISNFRPY